MNEKPRGRWYQFRLSTVLVLVAVCAWTMALRPSIQWGFWSNSNASLETRSIDLTISLDREGGDPFASDGHGLDNYCIELRGEFWGGRCFAWAVLSPKSIAYPSISLIAFLAWMSIGASKRFSRALGEPDLSAD